MHKDKAESISRLKSRFIRLATAMMMGGQLILMMVWILDKRYAQNLDDWGWLPSVVAFFGSFMMH